MNPMTVFWTKIGVAVSAFGVYALLLAVEMTTTKPLPADAKTLMTAAFGIVTGVISHLMTQKERSAGTLPPTVSGD